MRLLIGGSSTFHFHLKEFSDTLNKLGVESKLVFDADYSDGFPSRKIRNWFQTGKKFTKLIDEFKPDAIFIDRQRHFGIDALKANIPLFVLLRGHYWSEIDWNKKTMYNHYQKELHYGSGIIWAKKFSMAQLQFYQFVNIWKKLQTNLFQINQLMYFLRELMHLNGIAYKG